MMRLGIIKRFPIRGPYRAQLASSKGGQLRFKSTAHAHAPANAPAPAPAERLTEQVKPNTSYPKHVWSPAGGWYTQPANWKSNTAICIVIMFGIMTLVWDYGSKREVRVSHVEVDRKKWREEQQQKKKMKMKKTEQDH